MRKLVRWWFDQFARIFAAASAREHSDAAILEIDNHTLKLLFRSRGVTTFAAQTSANNPDIRQISRLVTDRDLPLLLRLHPAQVLHKRLSLPIAARHHLKQALGFEIDRETPFTADEVRWNYAVRRRVGSHNCVDIDLAVVPRCLVDPIVNCVRHAGLDPSGIEVDVGSQATVSIPLATQGRVQWRRSQRSLVVLGASACVLAFVAVATPFIYQQKALASADAMIGSLEERARAALALRDPVDHLATITAALEKMRAQHGSSLAALAAATKSLPDGTYLTAFHLRAGRLTVSGLSQSAAQLIGLLARTPAFREPTFDSPVVEGTTPDLEAFSISLNLVSGGAS